MRKFIILIIIPLLLASCNNTSGSSPEYLLQLVPGCAGFAIDHYHYMTAGHCADNIKYVTTIHGQILSSRLVYLDKTNDVAIVKTNDVMKIENFPRFGIEEYSVGLYYGRCANYMLTTGRAGMFVQHMHSVLEYSDMKVFYGLDKISGMFNQFGQYNAFCRGDSGGIFVANNEVAGMGIIVHGLNLQREGAFIYIVPGKKLKEIWNNYNYPERGNR